MTNNFAFEVKVDLCLKYTFTGGGWGWLDKSIIMLISAPVGFELGLGAELGNIFSQLYLSDSYGSFDIHMAMVHDILCHMIYVIKCHKVPFPSFSI